MTHQHVHHHQMPSSGRALSGVAFSATLHCLTGCVVAAVAAVFGTAVLIAEAVS